MKRCEAGSDPAFTPERESDFPGFKTRVARKEGLELPRPFFVQQRAGDIDDPSAGLHQLGRDVEQMRLDGCETL